jgi:tetratricopeptide (TPR) repeat protein
LQRVNFYQRFHVEAILKRSSKRRVPSKKEAVFGSEALDRRYFSWFRIVAISLAIVGAICGVLFFLPNDAAESPDVLIARARQAFASEDFDSAFASASLVPITSEFWEESRFLAGDSASRAGRWSEAVGVLQEIAELDSDYGARASFALGEIYRNHGVLSLAEYYYRMVLNRIPDDVETHQRIGFVLGVTGRNLEAAEHLMVLLKSGSIDLTSLAWLADVERSIDQTMYIEHCQRNAGEDVLVKLAVASQLKLLGKDLDALPIFESVVTERSDLTVARAAVGSILTGVDDQAMQRWLDDLPKDANGSAEIWAVRGAWARANGDLRGAAEAFWRVLEIAPEHRTASFQLGQVLTALRHPNAEAFVEHAGRLVELTQLLDEVVATRDKKTDKFQRIADLLEQSGRLWESWAWSRQALSIDPECGWAADRMTRLEAELSPRTERTIPKAQLARVYRLDFDSR